jgi:hypothetical protein
MPTSRQQSSITNKTERGEWRVADDGQIESVRQFRRFALAVCAIGVVVQLGLAAYYLGMGHRARPQHVPVGLVVEPAERDRVAATLTANGTFEVHDYQDASALVVAIKQRRVYGGADLTGDRPRLYVAGAAGPAAASLLRATYTSVVQQQAAAELDRLAAKSGTVPIAAAQALNAPPRVDDVVALPPDDVNGVSLGFLSQALALGGTIASMGLGRLIPRTRRSWKRGLAHVTTLILYAVGSAAAVLWTMTWFGVGITADRGVMLAIFSLVSLAITASTAGAVALVGPAGALVGAVYFTLGTVISGASFGREFGANLPTGAGVQAVRDNLYFPMAPIGRHLLVLALYAGVGCAVVLVTNLLPNRSDHTSEVELELVERLEGTERRESVLPDVAVTAGSGSGAGRVRPN